jgi:hypothetical protein
MAEVDVHVKGFGVFPFSLLNPSSIVQKNKPWQFYF